MPIYSETNSRAFATSFCGRRGRAIAEALPVWFRDGLRLILRNGFLIAFQ
jgi:hypothetical protein